MKKIKVRIDEAIVGDYTVKDIVDGYKVDKGVYCTLSCKEGNAQLYRGSVKLIKVFDKDAIKVSGSGSDFIILENIKSITLKEVRSDEVVAAIFRSNNCTLVITNLIKK